MPRGRRGRRVDGRVDGGPRGSRHRDRHRHPFHRARWPPIRSRCAASTSAKTNCRRTNSISSTLGSCSSTSPTAGRSSTGWSATLRPGGWIVIEDYDWSCFGFEGEDPGFGEIADVVIGFMAKAGFERDYGRRVVSDMEAAGLTEIRGEGRARLIDSTSPGFDFFRLSFESLRGAVVDGRAAVGRGSRGRCGRIRRGTAGCSRR